MSRRMALRSAAVFVVAAPAALLLVVGVSAPAGAATPQGGAGTGTSTVKASTDAWFSTSSACTESPTGCLPAGSPAPPYPAKTLHVGVGAGQEESRSYLALDLLTLPPGTALTGGTLRLPVGGMEDGSRAPDTASFQACLVTTSFKDDVNGSTEQPPAINCTAAAAPAKYVAAAGTAPAQFTVDLGAFATAWTAGVAGLALVPAPDQAPTTAWHVALSAHDRTGSTVPAPSATVTYASATADSEDEAFDPPANDAGTVDPGFGSGSAAIAGPALVPQPAAVTVAPAPAVQPAVAPQAAPVAPQQLQPQAFIGTGRFAYPGVFLLPIVFLVAVGWLARAMTRELVTA